jgi:hypothetical protein
VLPSVPEPLDEDLEKCLIGYLDHELGHVAFSDFGVAEQFARKQPGFEGLLNVIEDALIERRAMERWPLTRGDRFAMQPMAGGRESAPACQGLARGTAQPGHDVPADP